MKKFFLLLLIPVIALSCNKSTDDTASSSATFTITGIHDIDLTNSSDASYYLPVSVVPNPGSKDTVTLSVNGLPNGVYVDFIPATGGIPFTSRIKFRYDFSGTGGTYPVTITGTGRSGSRTYNLNLTLAYYRGWQFGGIIYKQKGVIKDVGDASHYPSIKVFGGGDGILTINFGLGRSLPTVNKTYKITSSSSDKSDDIQIAMNDDPLIYNATGVGSPTGTFTFDTLGKFTFKCTGVEMSDGVHKQTLGCSFSE